MIEAEKKVRAYLAEIGRRDGLASRRELTRVHAKKMIAIREAKRTALKASVREGELYGWTGDAWEGGRAPRSGIEENHGHRAIANCSRSPKSNLSSFIISRL